MEEWKEAQQQRLENADNALEAARASLLQKAGDIPGRVSMLQRWLNDQQQSGDSNNAPSAGLLLLESAFSAAHAGSQWRV